VIRGIPGRQLARASVGAWNTRDEIERLVQLAAAAR
jgi:selenocysteine lyase/cysteine desulfurase